MRSLNAKYPWLKLVALGALTVLVMLGGFATGRALGNLVIGGRPEVAQTETEAEDEAGAGNEETEEASGGASGDVSGETSGESKTDGEKPTEQKKPEEQPAAVAPAETPKPVTNTGRKLVALTFDDGPSSVTTGRLLDILKAKGVKATFFVVGNMARKAPELVRREEAEGHEVGSHSVAHQNLSKFGVASLQNDVAEMDRIFMEILGRKVAIMRPPYGAVSTVMRSSLGKPMINWAVDPLDWKYKNAATVRQNVVSATFDGAVVLMHDIHATTVDAVANIIDDLRARGYEFLTVSELAAARGVSLANGVVYYHFKP